MWLYKSPIGNIFIKQLPDGRFGMICDGTVWESCTTPQEEADNVYMQCTGCSTWDTYKNENMIVPTDLSEWDRI